MVTAALLSGLATIGEAELVLWTSGIALAVLLFLNAAYAHSLGERPRCERRMVGDRMVAMEVGSALLIPLAVAVAALVVGFGNPPDLWRFSQAETQALLAAFALFFVVVLLSGLVDWYYTRPRIDGVVREPPCASSRDSIWKRVTRRWYIHRMIASVSYIGMVAGIALTIMLMLTRERPDIAGLIGGVGTVVAIGLVFVQGHVSQMPTVANFILSPKFLLGDDLTYETDKWHRRGFVLHVAVPVAKLVELDDDGRPVEDGDDEEDAAEHRFEEPANSLLAEARCAPRQFRGCNGECAGVNPECVVGLPAGEAGRRRLVLL